MKRSWFLLGTFALLAGLAGAAQPVLQPGGLRPGVAVPAQPTANTATDEDVLKQAGLSATDGPRLVGYLKARTVSDSDHGRLQDLIAQLAADRFFDRLAAEEAIEQYGPAAIGPLKKAADQSGDHEIAYRARHLLTRVAKIRHAEVAAAAVRAVVRLKPPEAAPALLGFLPLADNDMLADEIRTALVDLAVRDGKPEPALIAALNDPSPLRRSAAYLALVTGGPAGERVRIPDALPLVKAAVRKDPDLDARFRGLWVLVVVAGEKEFVSDLITMTPQLPRGRLRQVEELLTHIAGTAPPGGRFGASAEELGKARLAWAGWWEQKGAAADLTKFPFHPKLLGCTDIMEADVRGFGQGRMVILGPDLKEKARLGAVNNVADIRILSNGHALVPEQNSQRVTERDPFDPEPGGRIVNQWLTPGQFPVAVQPLPNDGMLVVCRGAVFEFDKQKKIVAQYTRPPGPNGQQMFDIVSGRRLPGGDTIFVTYAPQGKNCFRLDAKLKDTGKSYTLGRMSNAQGMDVVGEDRVLVCEITKVAEYDLKTGGRLVWKYDIGQPTSVQRLPNGNTLIASLNMNKAIEVDPTFKSQDHPDGRAVWEYAAKDGLKVARAWQR